MAITGSPPKGYKQLDSVDSRTAAWLPGRETGQIPDFKSCVAPWAVLKGCFSRGSRMWPLRLGSRGREVASCLTPPQLRSLRVAAAHETNGEVFSPLLKKEAQPRRLPALTESAEQG